MEVLPKPGSIYAVTITNTPVWPGFITEEVCVLLMLNIVVVTTLREALYYADAL